MGVFDAELVEVLAAVLRALGSQRAMVLRAEDGLDEISTTSPTHVAELRDGRITRRVVRAEDFGLPRARLEDLAIGSPTESAQRIRQVLGGQRGPERDIVLLNAAAALEVAGIAPDMAAALPLGEKSIDSGAAAASLEKLIALSNSR
jgi:anthranilate phosphoribosyltransferase